jgi:hypothetical protein
MSLAVTATPFEKGKTMRTIRNIAYDIRAEWPKVNYAARPYLDAMVSLDRPSDPYGFDSGESIIRYFLANAGSFRGERAKALKAELKAMLKGETV